MPNTHLSGSSMSGLHALPNKNTGSAELIAGPERGHSPLQPLTSHSEANLRSVPTTSSHKTHEPSFSLLTKPDPQARALPYQPLTPEQQAKYDTCLDYFTNVEAYPTQLQPPAKGKPIPHAPATENEKMHLLTRESILRYLRATKWDVEDAKKRLTATIAFRREYGNDEIRPDYVEPEARSGKETVLGFDKYGRPLHYMHPHRSDTPETDRQMKFAVWMLDACIDLMPPGVEQLALLINFENKSRNPTSISNAKLMLYILQNHYVERLGVAMCINVPWIFKLFWNAIQSFIDPSTKSKCKFDEAIMGEVFPSQLLGDFGGDLDADYNHDLYWPMLVQTLERRRRNMLHRFRTVCEGKIGASEYVIFGGEDIWPGSAPARPPDVPRTLPQVPEVGSGANSNEALTPTAVVPSIREPPSSVSDPKARTRTSTPAKAANATLNAAEPASSGPEASTGAHSAEPQPASSAGIVLTEDHEMPSADNDAELELERFESARTAPEEPFHQPLVVGDQPLVSSPSKEKDLPELEASTGRSTSSVHQSSSASIAVTASRSQHSSDQTRLGVPEPKQMKRTESSHTVTSDDTRVSSGSSRNKLPAVGDALAKGMSKARKSHSGDGMRTGLQGLVRHGSQLLHGHIPTSSASSTLGENGARRQSRDGEAGTRARGRRSFSPHARFSRMLRLRGGSHDSAPSSGNADNSHASATSGAGDRPRHPERSESDEMAAHAAAVRANRDSTEKKLHHTPEKRPPQSGGPASSGETSTTVWVLYFAAARTALGKAREEVHLSSSPNNSSVAALVSTLREQHKGNAAFQDVLATGRWAVEEELVEPEEMESTTLSSGQTIALLPPVSGG